jgi:glycosyltransferase involved in cell wall biosynthesis
VTGPVLVGGLVPPGASGMRDYGRDAAAELRSRGIDANEWWLENDGVTLLPGVAVSWQLLRWAAAASPDSVVVWNYSPFAYAYRGLLVGALLRARGVRVITVLHEIAYPWGRRGLVGRIIAIAQHAALVPVLGASTAFVVTTEERGRFLRRFSRLSRRAPIEVVPVFSTVGHGLPPEAERDCVRRIGVIGYGGDGAQPQLFFDALAHLPPPEGIRIVMLGAPGPKSPQARAWVGAAAQAGMEHAVEFTGVLESSDLAARIGACDLVALVDAEGPTSRRTMLAAALAHGRPVVATDGPNRWDAPVHEGAIVVVPPEAHAFGATIRRLSEDPEARARMGALAFKFYEREMSLHNTCDVLGKLISGTVPASASPGAVPINRAVRRRRRAW